jgi:hypothetical protein
MGGDAFLYVDGGEIADGRIEAVVPLTFSADGPDVSTASFAKSFQYELDKHRRRNT